MAAVSNKVVGLVEFTTKNHRTSLLAWIEILQLKGVSAHLFLTEEIFEHVKKDLDRFDNIDGTTIFPSAGFISFLAMLKLKSISLFVFLSVQSHYLHYLLAPLLRVKYCVLVHNVSSWISPKFFFNIKFLTKTFVRLVLLRFCEFIAVNSENMRRFYLERQNFGKQVCVVPFSLERQINNSVSKEERFIVVYPGVVNFSRKRYEVFYHLARRNTDMDFVLLGRISKADQEFLYSKYGSCKNIQFYSDFVEQHEFERVMKRASLLFSDIVVEYQGDGFCEIYGRSKDSGVSYLMYEYDVPAILNRGFRNIEICENATFYFDDVSNADLVLGDAMRSIRSRSIKAIPEFPLSEIAQRLPI